MTREEIQLRQQLTALVAEMRGILTPAERANRSLQADEQRRYDAAKVKADELRDRIDRLADVRLQEEDLERPADSVGRVFGGSDGDPDGRSAGASLGNRVAQSTGLQAFRDNGFRGRSAIDLGDLSLRALISNNGTVIGEPMRLSGVQLAQPDRMLRLIDLIPHGDTTNNSVEYPQDTTANNDEALETAEGAQKPEGNFSAVMVTDPVRTIPVWMDISRQAAEDNGELVAHLDQRLRYKARRRFDSQVLNGDGVGVNLLGLLNRPGIQTLAPIAAEKRVITIRRAKTLLEKADFEGAVTVLNPSDWEAFELTTDNNGDFITDPVVRRARAVAEAQAAWGTDVALSNAVAAGTAMVADPTAAMIWDRKQPTAYMTDSDRDKFTANILTLLVELRAALSLFQPKGVVKVTFNGTA